VSARYVRDDYPAVERFAAAALQGLLAAGDGELEPNYSLLVEAAWRIALEMVERAPDILLGLEAAEARA
jgi:hypothetical protein